jgi:hypothetical protein
VTIQAATLVSLVFFTIFALVSVTPNVVALQLAWLVSNRERTRWLHWSMSQRVRVVVMTIILIVRECDDARALGVASDERSVGWRG